MCRYMWRKYAMMFLNNCQMFSFIAEDIQHLILLSITFTYLSLCSQWNITRVYRKGVTNSHVLSKQSDSLCERMQRQVIVHVFCVNILCHHWEWSFIRRAWRSCICCSGKQRWREEITISYGTQIYVNILDFSNLRYSLKYWII